MTMAPPDSPVSEQEVPMIQVVGRIAGDKDDDGETGTKYLLHCGWTRKTYQVSSRGLKVIRAMDIKVLDDPNDYVL